MCFDKTGHYDDQSTASVQKDDRDGLQNVASVQKHAQPNDQHGVLAQAYQGRCARLGVCARNTNHVDSNTAPVHTQQAVEQKVALVNTIPAVASRTLRLRRQFTW